MKPSHTLKVLLMLFVCDVQIHIYYDKSQHIWLLFQHNCHWNPAGLKVSVTTLDIKLPLPVTHPGHLKPNLARNLSTTSSVTSLAISTLPAFPPIYWMRCESRLRHKPMKSWRQSECSQTLTRLLLLHQCFPSSVFISFAVTDGICAGQASDTSRTPDNHYCGTFLQKGTT